MKFKTGNKQRKSAKAGIDYLEKKKSKTNKLLTKLTNKKRER